MAYPLPYDLLETQDVALVLAYGRLSLLEACTVLGQNVRKVESPSERVAVLHLERPASSLISSLAGVHKAAPLLATAGADLSEAKAVVDALAGYVEDKQNVSVSGYDIAGDQYEDLVRETLNGLKSAGVRKVRLLRPEGDELLAEQVLSRRAADVVAFPYHGGIGLGVTAWVPNSAEWRRSGTDKPVPRPDISLPHRLARVLLNLGGLSPGETLLDPFCGSGTILSEGYAMSCRCLGLDVMASRVQEARENLAWFGGGSKAAGYDVRKGDARDLPRLLHGTQVDVIATEPLLLPRLEARPKTATAAQMVEKARDVYSDSLAAMARVLRPGGRLVIVVPVVQTMDGEEVSLTLEGRKLGLKPFQPGPVGFEYPVRLSFESTRWVRRAVYVFEASP